MKRAAGWKDWRHFRLGAEVAHLTARVRVLRNQTELRRLMLATQVADLRAELARVQAGIAALERTVGAS